MHRREIFDVLGKRYKYFWKALSNRNFLYEEETYKKIVNKKIIFQGFNTIRLLDFIYYLLLKIGLFFVKKQTNNTVNN